MTDRRLPSTFSCGGCAAIWAGTDRAHCGTCHETWDDVTLYDQHRPRGVCQRPADMGLVSTKNGIWQRPDSA
ncbi:hypothetical protein BJF78_17735 [Pseudonocardia sp. CNS-139]|nr:hypothetical protein BJF78_17735 [Pseudonocardia sp. CNS-139]